MEKTPYTRQNLINSLLHISHNKLDVYSTIGLYASQYEPELYAHFVAWNAAHGKIRDSKIAHGVLSLRNLTGADHDLAESSIASLLLLSPRQLVRAYDFHTALTAGATFKRQRGGVREILQTFEHGPAPIRKPVRRMLQSGLRQYLIERQGRPYWWDRNALQFREDLIRLYRIAHQKPSERAQAILFDGKYPAGSVFAQIATLNEMSPQDAGATILKFKLPIEVAMGAYRKEKGVEFWLALITGMTGNQLVTNAKMLQRHKVFDNAILKAAYDKALTDAANSKKSFETLKAGRAAETLLDDGEDTDLAAKLINLQRAKTAQLAGIEGDWLVLADASGSMRTAIELGRQIAAMIAGQVKGSIYLVFFNTVPAMINVTGLSYDQIVEKTRRIVANGGTSIGCGLDYLRENKIVVNGIAIASDGGDNSTPFFHDAYKKYADQMGVEPTAYLFHVLGGEGDHLTGFCKNNGIRLERFEMGANVDYYSLPALIQALRTNRYSLVDEIMATPLLTFADVFKEREAA